CAPPFAAAGALGAAAAAGRHRRRAPRPRANAEGRGRAGHRVRRTATAKLGAYTALAGMGLVAALVIGRPELVALAAPFALVLLAGLSLAQTPEVDAVFGLDQERPVQGEAGTAELGLRARTPASFELLLDLPRGLVAETPNPQILRLAHDERRELEFELRCEEWGGYVVGGFLLRSRDDFGLLVHEWSLSRPHPLKVYP